METTIRDILGNTFRKRILEHLHSHANELTGRELARQAGFSPQQTHNTLNKLIAAGLVERRICGPTHLFRLNRKSGLAAKIEAVLFPETLPAGKAPAFAEITEEGHEVCWDKAMEFLDTMLDAYNKGRWNTVVLAGTHCCLTATCAVLKERTGKYPDPQQEQQFPAFAEIGIAVPGSHEQGKMIKLILAHKELVETAGNSYPGKAAAAFKQAVTGYIKWLKNIYPGSAQPLRRIA